eukprot:6482951-Amphidinium_carterae.1
MATHITASEISFGLPYQERPLRGGGPHTGPWHSIQLGGNHINCVELQAVCSAILGKEGENIFACPQLHTASLRQINATILARSLLPHWTYVRTDCNLADKLAGGPTGYSR